MNLLEKFWIPTKDKDQREGHRTTRIDCIKKAATKGTALIIHEENKLFLPIQRCLASPGCPVREMSTSPSQTSP